MRYKYIKKDSLRGIFGKNWDGNFYTYPGKPRNRQACRLPKLNGRPGKWSEVIEDTGLFHNAAYCFYANWRPLYNNYSVVGLWPSVPEVFRVEPDMIVSADDNSVRCRRYRLLEKINPLEGLTDYEISSIRTVIGNLIYKRHKIPHTYKDFYSKI